MKRNKFFFLVLAIPLIVLLGMTFKPLQATYQGEKVMLQTMPVDPRDLLYGDYVTLNFEIERIGYHQLDNELSKEFNMKKGYKGEKPHIEYVGEKLSLPVYIVLKEVDGVHQVKYVTEEKPTSGIYIKGKLDPYSGWDNKLRVQLPFERYYVEESTGLEIENRANEGKIVAEVKVHDGYAIIKDIVM